MCNSKTFSLQIVAVGPNKNQIQVPVFGPYKCSLNSIWYHSPNNAGQVDVIRINSPQFRLKYSSAVAYSVLGALESQLSAQPYPVFLSTPNAQVGGLNGTVEWEHNFQGTVEVEIENLTGARGLDDVCVITINLTPVHE
jgi:hypothetical protein